ncbi:ABC transporter ATP-binding protein [Synechocystis sp. FACHB-383]|uniref:ABC transporter ATP-binding protein n=1 Tax=Synechocystis sp. FACHB-383 TaxID=2692864 RepID=UPI0016869555|nr:ABC transporter ATP-binding protein [Synechocystis sp. FACHB-383]MBD2655391.1 ABC transporter ATP-binding protein [Synechocystis sp. FACHB-383]
MSDVMIRVENLGKKYMIGHQAEGRSNYVALRDVLADGAKSLVKQFTGRGKGDRQTKEEFWALKDVSFEVKRGECVGIIGRNGAGKSTLLKILSRITEPTTGRVELHGRVASLLEVGTGFHPELTGRENIYLNGAILGMTRAEIKKKFDEIVDFAEVERFLDTPVKRYSSGMYVRLAFAVAAHLEPEILVVDEVLAVGDAAFQKKCLGKMGDVAEKEGRTVLFVSHNMTAIQMLCQLGLFLNKGETLGTEEVKDSISRYSLQTINNHSISFPIQRDEVIVHDFQVSQNGFSSLEYDGGEPIDIKIDFELDRDLTLFRIGIFLKTVLGDIVFRSLLADWNEKMEFIAKGRYLCFGKIPKKFITAGNYILELHSSRYGIKDYNFGDFVHFQLVVKSPIDFNPEHIGERSFGIVLVDCQWSLT